jgi:pimeloyl-ACP methyl ester carboxylesterase
MQRRCPQVLAGLLVPVLSLALAAQAPAPAAKQMPANGTSLAWVEQGSGPPVVFVHGAISDLRFWEPQREAFAKGHRFIAYTYRYHGSAPWSDDGKQYSARTHAADLAAFLKGLKAGPVHLVGLSYGGLLAAMVAMESPQLLRTVTLAEPALFSVLAETPDGKEVLEAWNKAAATAIGAPLEKGDAVAAAKGLAAVVHDTPGYFDQLPPAGQQMLLDNARTMPFLMQSMPDAITCARLGAIKTPTLLVRGADTPPVFAKTNEAVGRCIPGSRQVVVPQASHTMSVQNPGAFNDAVLKFVGQHRGPRTAQRLGNWSGLSVNSASTPRP